MVIVVKPTQGYDVDKRITWQTKSSPYGPCEFGNHWTTSADNSARCGVLNADTVRYIPKKREASRDLCVIIKHPAWPASRHISSVITEESCKIIRAARRSRLGNSGWPGSTSQLTPAPGFALWTGWWIPSPHRHRGCGFPLRTHFQRNSVTPLT